MNTQVFHATFESNDEFEIHEFKPNLDIYEYN